MVLTVAAVDLLAFFRRLGSDGGPVDLGLDAVVRMPYLILTLIVFSGVMVGSAAGVLAVLGGISPPMAVLTGGAAFAGWVTLCLLAWQTLRIASAESHRD